MTKIPITYELTIVHNQRLYEIISELISVYEELYDLIPEWNNIEAKEYMDKIDTLFGKLFELKISNNS